MFFDYREVEEERGVGTNPDGDVVFESTDKTYSEWKRVQRRIYSPFWRFIHNLIAHPLLAICRPIGERLHEFTAKKMYEPRGTLPLIVSDDD